MSKPEQTTIQGDPFEPSHFMMIPNIAKHELDIYELALYCHYRWVIWENKHNGNSGVCWQSNKTVAEGAKMSVNRMKKARQGLIDKGYITLEYRYKDDGSDDTAAIYLVI